MNKRWSSMRALVCIASWSLLVACRRDASQKIFADPTPSTSAKPPTPRRKPAVQREIVEKKGPPAISLAWPRIDVEGGAAPSKAIEDDLRAEEKDIEDKYAEVMKGTGYAPSDPTMQWTLDVTCTAPLVSYDAIDVVCDHGSYQGGAHDGFWTTTRTWMIEGASAREIGTREIFGETGVVALSKLMIERLKALGASFVVDGTLGAEDLVKDKSLDVFTVDAQGLRFVFSPYAVASWAEGELSVHLDWKELRTLAPTSTLLPRLEAATRSEGAIVAPFNPDDDDPLKKSGEK